MTGITLAKAATKSATVANALRLLESLPRDQAVPEGDGMMVGRLRESIEHEIAEHAR